MPFDGQKTAVFNGFTVPISPQLANALTSGDPAEVWLQEAAYFLQLLSTPKGCDWLMMQNALGAHYTISVDPARVTAHMTELQERGIVERVEGTGKFRVRPEAIEQMQQSLKDDGIGHYNNV